MGSMGAFLVLESAEAAEARGAKVLAEVDRVASGWAKREAGAVEAEMTRLIGEIGQLSAGTRTVSAAAGVAPWAAEERTAIAAALPDGEVTAVGDLVGHGLEAAFPMAAALATILVAEDGAAEVLVTGTAHWRGEGAARIVAPGAGGSS
jgi:3-oxoacyl-[acyl-carrier-protein] synthase II